MTRRIPRSGLTSSAPANGMVQEQDNHRADDGHDDAFDVEPADSRHRMHPGLSSEGLEEPPADHRADDAEEDVPRDALAPFVDDLAGEKPRDESEDDPGDERQGALLFRLKSFMT